MNSPKQLQAILYDKLHLPILQKTPTGQPSTAEPVLQELAFEFEIAKLILQYRSLSKLKSTYTDALPEQVHPRTGRVHTSYHQAVTATGRLSSSDPNLQNIPIRNEEGRKIRRAFIAPPGYQLLSADYSQIELRIMAHLAQDERLMNAFQQGEDIHQMTAAEVFGVSLADVLPEQRRRAKAINFGLMYGMSAFGLSKQLGVPREEAEVYINRYFQRYPRVKIYMEETRLKAHRDGFVETCFGRRLYLPDIHTRNLQRQRAVERAAINAPLQGTAADIVKLAMTKVHQWLVAEKLDAHMILQVHDELVFEIREPLVSYCQENIKRLMETVVDFTIPLLVEVGVGEHWEAAH